MTSIKVRKFYKKVNINKFEFLYSQLTVINYSRIVILKKLNYKKILQKKNSINNVSKLDFSFWNYTFLVIYLYGEIFYKLVFLSIFKNLKQFNILNAKNLNVVPFKKKLYVVAIIFLTLFYITNKNTIIVSNIYFLISLILLFVTISTIYDKSNFMFLYFNLLVLLNFFTYINSLIVFFLFIEVYAILFYFIFLNNIKIDQSFSVLKLKNTLILYLLSNFLTTVLLLLGLIGIVEFYGSCHINELNVLVSPSNLSLSGIFIIIGFFIKLSLPMVHFLKFEIYKYIPSSFVILFSSVLLCVNYFLVINFLNFTMFLYLINTYKLGYIIIVTNLLVLTQKLKLVSFNEFIAYSGFATNNIIVLSLFLINEKIDK